MINIDRLSLKTLLLFTLLLVCCIPFTSHAQISISSSSAVTENFNSLGALGTAALPTGWKMSSAGTGSAALYGTTTNLTVVTQQASTGSPTTGGRYNWGTTAGTDRAVGFMTSGSYASPNAIMAYYRNTSGSQINDLTITFDIERYRVNATAFSLTFFTSTDSTASWTSRTSGDIASTVFGTASSAYDFTAATFVTKTVTLTGVNIPNNGNFFMKWIFTNGSSNSQGIGLDNVTLTPTLSSSITATLGNITQPSGSIPQGGTDVVLSGFTLGSTASANFTAVTLSSAGTATSSDITSVRVFRDNDGNGAINGADASVSGTGATYAASMPLTISGETGITTTRNYLVVANVAGAGVSTLGRTATVSVGSAAFTTTASVNTGSATGNSRDISATAPVLTAAAGATVDAAFAVTFTDDASWRAAGGTTVTVNGTPLTAGYSITSGQILFTPSASTPATLLQTSGSKSISISKTGYGNATVTQSIGAGAATQLSITTQPAAPASNGVVLATQPIAVIRDQYSNTTTSTATVLASVGSGTWTIGGTVSVNAVNGTVTFTNLTATSTAAVTGATIQLTSTGLTGATSSGFNIPVPDYTVFSGVGTSITENFNSMGTSGTATLPPGFVTSSGTTYSGGTSATTLAYGSSGTGAVTGTSPGGTINWATGATGSSTERAIGYLTTGTFTSPRSLMCKYKNLSGATITSLVINFDYEKYRSGSREFDWTFFYGTDGTTWTAAHQGDQAYPADATSTVIYATPLVTAKSVSITGVSIANGSDFYLQWTYTGVGGSTNGQGLAIDNLSIVPFSNTNTSASNITGSLTNLNITGGITTLTGNTDITNMTNFVTGSSIDLAGHTLTLNGDINGTLTVTGSPASGLIIGGSGTTGVIMPDQTSSDSRSLNTLTINRTGSTITLGDNTIVTGTLTLSNGTLATGNKLTLASTSSGTAGVAAITGTGAITGNVTAERYIASSGRRWRFMSSCMSNATLEDWRNETYITGAGTGTTAGTLNSNGFDATLSNSPSMYSYNEPVAGNYNNGWVEVTNSTSSLTNILLTPGKGYRMFIRGDRSDAGRLSGTNTTQNEVTLNLTGTINSGNITMPVSYTNTLDVTNDGWNLLGNPYPAAFDWNAFYNDGTNLTNIDPTIYILDANSNTYKSYNATSSGSLMNGIIPSGASFWVKANAASPTLTFKENFKATSSPMAVHKTAVNDELNISMVLDSVDADEFILKFINGSTEQHDGFDIKKLSNATVNISSVGTDGIYHTLDARPDPATDDTVQLYVSGSNGSFAFKFNSIPANGKYYFLYDSLNGSMGSIDPAVPYNFTISSSVPASFGTRFKIIISNNASLPVVYQKFTANRIDNIVVLNWETASEINNKQFEIERSDDNKSFTTIGTVKGAGSSTASHKYRFVDEHPVLTAINYYRLKQTDFDGQVSYAPVQVVSFMKQPVLTLIKQAWPNPVQDLLTIELVPANYTITVYNSNGKQISQQEYDAATGKLLLNTTSFQSGMYVVKVLDASGNSETLRILKE